MSIAAPWDVFAKALASPHYLAAQHRVLRQLVEALLFERILDPEVTPGDRGMACFHIPARTQQGCLIGYRCHGRISGSFGRIRLDNLPLMRIGPDAARPVASIQEFLFEAAATIDVDEALLVRFLHELQQTLLKDTLSRYTRGSHGHERDLTALEGQLQDGHPYHPCYKSRVGFDPVDNFAYGPEFEPEIRLLWLALRRKHAVLAVCRDRDIDDLLREELGEAQHAHFTSKLSNLGLAPHDYLLLPVHPWQWREKIASELFPLLQCQDLVLLGTGEDRYRPLQSIRSLANVGRPWAANVKLPVGIVNTSADRILSCHNVENAAPVSDWLCEIRVRDETLDSYGLVFLREVAGITYGDRHLPPFLQDQQYGMLGAIWRESVDKHLQIGESAAPFSGLCQCEANGRPFIAPWIERYGLACWLDDLLKASLPPLVHLLYAHGIGMEAHAQNIVLIHRNGQPCRIALKDLPGGLRFMRQYLEQPKRCPPLAPTPPFRRQANAIAGMEAATPEQVRDYFHDAVFFINFGELSLFLHHYYALSEADFWARVAACLFDYQAHHPELASRFACFDLFASTVLVEQLAKRRLFAETEARLHAVPNPLHRYRHQAGKKIA